MNVITEHGLTVEYILANYFNFDHTEAATSLRYVRLASMRHTLADCVDDPWSLADCVDDPWSLFAHCF